MDTRGKKEGPIVPDYNYVLTKYIKNLDKLKQDYECDEKGISNNIFATDFSEIFLYMYNPRGDSSRADTRLINYLFRKDLNRDFKLTLFPPAIFELRRHYDYLQGITNKYRYYKKPRDTQEFKKIQEAFKDLPEEGEIGDPNAEKYQKILRLWNDFINKFRGFDYVATMATEYGSENILDKGHKRLVNLFREGVIIAPQKIEAIGGRIQEVESNEKIFWKCMIPLSKKRSKVSSYQNNLVDAEHAAIDYAINNRIFTTSSNCMDIYTGSPTPLKIYEKKLRIENKELGCELCLVRSPIYFMIRLFCNNELRNTGFDKCDFLESSVDLLTDLKKSESFEGLKRKLNTEMGLPEKIPPSHLLEERPLLMEQIERISSKTLHSLLVFNIFFSNENFSNYFNDALKSKYYYSVKTREHIKNRFYSDDIEKLKRLNELTLVREVLEDQNKFEEELAKTQEKIYENTKSIYGSYYELLEGYDYSKLSPLMKQCYDHIHTEPEESDETQYSREGGI